MKRRSEQEMMELILHIAHRDERIRAVLLHGSRANPDITKDQYQDYDIVYVVEDIAPFLATPKWIDVFGKRAIMQCPEELDAFQGKFVDTEKEMTYLMLFQDHQRIDLKLMQLHHALTIQDACHMGNVLLDKDHLFHDVYEPAAYNVTRLTKQALYAIYNEFWWCIQNVGKGLARNELPYASGMLETVVRPALHQMMDQYIMSFYEEPISTGKLGRRYQELLPADVWNQYLLTYSDLELSHMWNALYQMCDFFSMLSSHVYQSYGYPLANGEELGIRAYLSALHE